MDRDRDRDRDRVRDRGSDRVRDRDRDRDRIGIAPQLASVCADVHNERQRTNRQSCCTAVKCLRYKHCIVPPQPSDGEPEGTMVRLIES